MLASQAQDSVGRFKEGYSDVQKSVPVKPARLLPYITIGCCFDSHPRIDSVLQKPGFRYGLLESAIYRREKPNGQRPSH